MPKPKKIASKRSPLSKNGVPSLNDALRRMRNPDDAEALSLHFEELANAMREGASERVHELCDEILYVLGELPDGPIDMPLVTSIRIRERKRRKRSRKVA